MPEMERKILILAVKPTRLMRVEDFLLFAEGMGKYDVDPRDEIRVEITAEGWLKFHVPVTVKALPKKTAQQRAVELQLAERKKAVAAKEQVPGHVPPARVKRKLKVNTKWRKS